jgi:hypothetical protein
VAYSDFTFDNIEERLGLTLIEVAHTFEAIAPVAPSDVLVQVLERGMPLVLGAGKEKTRSEALVFPVLLEVRELRQRHISVFSGQDFPVDRKRGLSGFCDYLLSLSPLQSAVHTPVAQIVEAKHEDLTSGVPQCLAAMYGAWLYNARKEHPLPIIYGATTSGTAWRFLRLTDGGRAEIDLTEYHIREVEKILGILLHMVTQQR